MTKNNKKITLKNNTLLNFVIIVLLFFAYSRSSWGNFIPILIWQLLLVMACLSMILYIILRKHIDFNTSHIFFLMMFIIFLINNHDVKQNGLLSTIDVWIYVFLALVVLSQDIRWVKWAIKTIICLSVFYAFMTMVCNIYKPFYYNVVYPSMSKYVTVNWFKAHPSAGFTTDYSVNSFYLAIGCCATLVFVIGRNYIKNRRGTCSFIIITLGIMMAGKRAIVMGIVAAFLVSYINITSKDKRNRYTKLILGFGGAILILLLLSFFIPSMNYTIERFIEKIEMGDITSGRMEYWIYSWFYFLKKPFWGYGWRWFAYNNPFPKVMDVHNTLLQLLLETGIIGTIIFFLFFARELIYTIKLSREIIRERELFTDEDIIYIYFSLAFQVYYMFIIEMGTGFYSTTGFMTYFICCSIIEYYRNNNALMLERNIHVQN